MKTKSLKTIAALIAIALLASSFVTEKRPDSSESSKGQYWYFTLRGKNKETNKNCVIITSVFYSANEPTCSDLHKHAMANYDNYQFWFQYNCLWGYDTQGEAARSRDEAIASFKQNNTQILYSNFTGY